MGKKKIFSCNFDRKNLHYYYGIPHAHTSFSTGRGNPLEAFEYGMDNGLDFMMLTDHNSFLTRELLFEGENHSKWNISNTICERLKRKNENFLPIIGFETRTDPFGDFNIINSNNFFTGIVKDLKLLVLWILNNPNSFVILNHPHKNVLNLDYSPLLNKIITSVEVCNGSPPRKYLRSEKYYYILLDNGWKLGAVNGQDNHRINFGDSENLTCIITNRLDESNLIDAFRCRRTYSTESRTLKLHFTLNDYFMGSEIEASANTSLRFEIFLEDIIYKIEYIEIITNGGKVLKKSSLLNLNKIKYLYHHIREPIETWYLIKIIESNGKIAYSSPIFIV